MVKMMSGYLEYLGIKASKKSREMIQDIMDSLDDKTENNTSVSSNL